MTPNIDDLLNRPVIMRFPSSPDKELATTVAYPGDKQRWGMAYFEIEYLTGEREVVAASAFLFADEFTTGEMRGNL